MTDETRTRINRLVGENVELKRIAEEAEETMKANRQELGKILKQEGVRELPLGYATVKLNTTRISVNWEYIKSLPGYSDKGAKVRVKCAPFVSICLPKTRQS